MKHLLPALICCVLTSQAVFAQTIISPASGGDIAAPLNAAIATCSSTTGCTLEIAPSTSTLLLNSVVTVTKSNVRIHCIASAPIYTNISSTPLSSTTGDYSGVIDIVNVDNVELSGCTLYTDSLGTTAVPTIRVWGSSNVRVHDMTLHSSVSPVYPALLGIRAEGSTSAPSQNITADHNKITTPSIGLSVGDNGQHIDYHDNSVTNSYQCFDFNGQNGGAHPDATDINFHDNSCAGNTASSYVESASNVRVKNNSFWKDSSGQAAIVIHNTLPTVPNLHVDISENSFVGAGVTAYAAWFYQNGNHWAFSNNRVQTMRMDGILVDSTSGTPVYGEVTNNQFIDNGQAGASGGYCGVRLHQSAGNNVGFLTISTNLFVDDQGSSPTQAYPVCSDGGQTPFYLKITNNQNYLANAESLPAGCNDCMVSGNFKP
ncbi:hypothetical protein AB4Y89_14595 [Terriglobus sp. 2YAB30_2]|uniref:hypothetical protein n=1 Tax=unclassified Terriglobus TaxID=2628988 RepID=UPI003F973A8B